MPAGATSATIGPAIFVFGGENVETGEVSANLLELELRDGRMLGKTVSPAAVAGVRKLLPGSSRGSIE